MIIMYRVLHLSLILHKELELVGGSHALEPHSQALCRKGGKRDWCSVCACNSSLGNLHTVPLCYNYGQFLFACWKTARRGCTSCEIQTGWLEVGSNIALMITAAFFFYFQANRSAKWELVHVIRCIWVARARILIRKLNFLAKLQKGCDILSAQVYCTLACDDV